MMKHKWMLPTIILMARFIMAVYGIISLLLLALWAAGFQKFIVTSGSMLPAIPVGSCICVTGKDPEEIQEGEILTFYLSGTKTTVTHRVIENDRTNKCLWTKGDANEIADGAPVAYTNAIGTVRIVLPFAGYLLVFLNSIHGKLVLLALFLACVLLQNMTER